MGINVLRQKNVYLKKCDKCTKPSHYIYTIFLGGIRYNFCSGLCADAARVEFEKKQALNITPSNPEGGVFDE